MKDYTFTDERMRLCGRNEYTYNELMKRLKPRDIREGTGTGLPNDGKTPFEDVFEEFPDEPYIICLAKGIVRSWLVGEKVIHKHEYFVGIPRPKRNLNEYFARGITGAGRFNNYWMPDGTLGYKDPRIHALRDRLFPMNDSHMDGLGMELLGHERFHFICDDSLWGTGGYQGHSAPNYRRLLTLGLPGLLDMIDEYDAKTPAEETDKKNFYEACRIIVRGLGEYLCSYAEYARAQARSLAQDESDAEWKAELLAIADNCEYVSKNKPKTFFHAGQLTWTFCLWDWVDCTGRFDQYMAPFYTGSEEDDRMVIDLVMKYYEHGIHSLTIGGVRPENGADATNPITYLVLQTIRTFHDCHPRVSVRIHRDTPQELLDLCVKLWSEGMSDPSLASDATVIRGLMEYGIPLSDARDYCIVGCQEVEVQGKSNFGTEDGIINLAKILEYTLNHGKSRRCEGPQIVEDRGGIEDFDTFDKLWDAYWANVEYLTPIFLKLNNAGQEVKTANVSKLVKSVVNEACIERGTDMDNSGTLYNLGCIETAGASAVSDSLYAMKKLVYEEKKISLETLSKAIAADFEGYEPERRMLLNAPKFGDDDDECDAMAYRVLDRFWTLIGNYRSVRGGPFSGACSLLEGGVSLGELTWALPDGRHAGDPLGNTIGPRTGSNKNGLTSMLRSVAKLPLNKGIGGTTCNVLIPKALMETDELRKNVATLMKTFLQSGGQLAQITTASLEEMKDAQVHPENHRDLIVRVGGYSEKFVQMEKKSQDEIILRYGLETR